jgi:hypothetical protein
MDPAPGAMGAECIIGMLLETPFSRKTHQEKLQIVERGRPRPEIPGLLSEHKEKGRIFMRHFHSTEFDKVLWMTGSASLNKLFCWPCLLFGHDKSAWNKEGIANLNTLSNSVKKHQRFQKHILAQLMFCTFGNTRIDLQLDEQHRIQVSRHNELVTHNRDILKRLIDSVCHLAKLEAPFRGHDESSTSLNKGHYLELLSLIGSYDNLLKSHLDTATVFRGTSNRIQNDLIEAFGEVVLDKIKEEVKNASFVAILLDETTDATRPNYPLFYGT